jgi:tRNA modification GTPase
MYVSDTIAAVSTPLGEGGIGIIRVSGDGSYPIAEKLFKKIPDGGFDSHRFYYGLICDPASGETIDEGMFVFMKGPRSYTREDVLEIQCHGGYLLVQRVLSLVLECGARLAEPGEFTKRAFLNGRIDLAQAEAVIDVIRGKSEAAVLLAQHQREGILSKEINRIRDHLLDLLSLVEAYIDFPEEEIGAGPEDEVTKLLIGITEKINFLIEGYDEGRSLREGVSVLIAGKPNVGKSSLLNALAKEKRAIVNSIPGTTRDVIEEVINFGGLPVRMLDTAGICETTDPVEREGVELALSKIKMADLVLLVLDSSRSIDEDDLSVIDALKEKKIIVVFNKSDLPEQLQLPESLSGHDTISISAKSGSGMEELKETVKNIFLHGKAMDSREFIAVSNVRHRESLVKCNNALSIFARNAAAGSAAEILAADIREALLALGEITGETIEEEVLGRIFERFCIGK